MSTSEGTTWPSARASSSSASRAFRLPIACGSTPSTPKSPSTRTASDFMQVSNPGTGRYPNRRRVSNPGTGQVSEPPAGIRPAGQARGPSRAGPAGRDARAHPVGFIAAH
jgi:hypothetical protein